MFSSKAFLFNEGYKFRTSTTSLFVNLHIAPSTSFRFYSVVGKAFYFVLKSELDFLRFKIRCKFEVNLVVLTDDKICPSSVLFLAPGSLITTKVFSLTAENWINREWFVGTRLPDLP